jgi:hypothetical protein
MEWGIVITDMFTEGAHSLRGCETHENNDKGMCMAIVRERVDLHKQA